MAKELYDLNEDKTFKLIYQTTRNYIREFNNLKLDQLVTSV